MKRVARVLLMLLLIVEMIPIYSANAAGNDKKTKGDVVVDRVDTILKGTDIKGNLYLTEDIGQGNVTLEGVTVKGTTFVNGGGEDTVIINNSKLENLVVNKKDSKIRVNLTGSTTVKSVELLSGGKLDAGSLNKGKMKDVLISTGNGKIDLVGDYHEVTVNHPNTDKGLTINIKGMIKKLTLNGEAIIHLDETTIIDDLNVNEKAGTSTIDGKGKIEKVKNNSKGLLINGHAVPIGNSKGNQYPEKTPMWTMVWNDEFDGEGNVNTNGVDLDKWGFQNGNGTEYGNPGWGNNELQFYREENTRVEDGKLIITAKEEDHKGSKYTSGKLVTDSTFAKAYGKFEARMKLPEGTGFWPAFWMMPKDSVYGGWAVSGEIDIMEARGRLINQVGAAIHYGRNWPNNKHSGGTYVFPEGEDFTDFHTYGIEWEPGEIRWYVDGELYLTQNNWDSWGAGQPAKYAYPAPFDQEFFYHHEFGDRRKL